MNVRKSIALIVSICGVCLFSGVVAHPIRAKNCSSSAKAFVEKFYSWYAPLAATSTSDKPAWIIAIQGRGKDDFEGQLVNNLLRVYHIALRSEGYTIGLDFDPFLASQDPCAVFKVSNVAGRGTYTRVTVRSACSVSNGASASVVAVLRETDCKWRFANFYYLTGSGSKRSDLISILRSLESPKNSGPAVSDRSILGK